MFTAVLLTTAKTAQLMDKQIVAYIHIKEYYSEIENWVLVHAVQWMKPENMTLSEKKPIIKY